MRRFAALAASISIVVGTTTTAAATGTFRSSDPQLNAIWLGSVRTAQDMLAPGPLTIDSAGRPCAIGLPVVILDGVARDRCPYVGDEAVIDRTLDASTPHWDVQRAMLGWFAAHQHADGSIPSSPIFGASMTLVDYNAYWLLALHDYALYSGDIAFARSVWPSVLRLVDGYYARQSLATGLLRHQLGSYDYAYIRRRGEVVAYYNALYAYALQQTAETAAWVGDAAHHGSLLARSETVRAAFGDAFWDARAGSFRDSVGDSETHPEDAAAFAALARLGSAAQRSSALAYLWNHGRQEYGNTIVDSSTWDGPSWGWQGNLRVYPFISYFDVLARFESGDDAAALDLLRREWGYMLAHGPGTMWETIGPYGGGPTDKDPSWDAGWSSGAAPALTQYVLGVRPTSPGYATFVVEPRMLDVASASGDVPTPHGSIHIAWAQTERYPVLRVDAPPGTVWQRAVRGRRGLTPRD